MRKITTQTPKIAAFSVTLSLFLAGCAVNPVTGERELSLISTPEQIAIGEQQYFPSRQMQGGDYVVDRALADYVAGVGQRVAQHSDLPLPYEFVVLNSSVPNAWALPGGKIAVNRGLLLELGSEAELAAVLGHEIVHAAAGHGAQAMQRGMILQGVLVATAVAAQRSDYSGLAIGAASVGAQLLNQRYSRDAELEADAYGITYMAAANYDPAAAITLQETFVRLSENRSGGWLEGLFASHPPSQERVDRNRDTVARIPPGGDVGRESFQAATRRLRETQPAYEAHDEARVALSEGRVADAIRLATRAVELVPREALFHALEGDIEMSQERYADAVAHYGDAIELDGRFFYYQLQKGLAHYVLNQSSAAETHLLNSLDLLPTADAHYALGAIAESRGDVATAFEHYAAAAGSNTPAGQAAQVAVIRLDLPQNPGRYLQVGAVTDARGQLVAQVTNPTSVVVANVVLIIRFVDAGGAIRQTSRVINQALTPGAGIRI
ncbi:MAG TPA: M48 family metalloprotease, partial [Gammaproteobacteria bacterium]